jgi:hypothetical protein
MISIKWDRSLAHRSAGLPQGWAFFAFLRGEEPLWCGYTADLNQRLETVIRKAEESNLYQELSSTADTLAVESHPEAMAALIQSKVYAQTKHPSFQNRLRPWENYAYLALDAYRFPFVSVQQDTNGDWLYLGPFRSRFFLADVMDTVARLLKVPFCETGTYPCERLTTDHCRGYCLSLDEPDQGDNLEKLDKLIKEAYLHPNNNLAEMIQSERDRYFNELEFEKAELLDQEIGLLQKYRDWLNFLYVTRSLCFEEAAFSVANGLLRSATYDRETCLFPVETAERRENERLAIDLHQLDEARTIYEYYIKHKG